MAGVRLSSLVRRMRADVPATEASSDADLLARFVKSRDDAAFELLVWRHGAMVLSACRRVLRNDADAEDAFQAVFLVLARRAASVSRGAALPAWLHRVAVRVSTRLARSVRPTAPLEIERAANAAPDPLAADELAVLDAEIDRLPERQRRAVVLCYLEGLTAADAGVRLGCPTGTVESRLASARKRLRAALTRRGVTLPAALAGSALAPEAAARTARDAVAFVSGGVVGVASESSVRLAREVLAMWQARTWGAAAVLATAVLVATAAGLAWADPPVPPPAPEPLAALDEPPRPRSEEERPGATKPDPKGEAWGPARNLGKPDGLVYAVSPDGNEIVVRPNGKAVTLLDLRTGKVSRVGGEFGSHMGSISYSPDGQLVACAEWTKGATLRDAKTWEVVQTITPGSTFPVSTAAFTPDGKQVALYCYRSASWGQKLPPNTPLKHYDVHICLWDISRKKEIEFPAEERVAPPTTHFHEGTFVHRPFLFSREDVRDANGNVSARRLRVIDMAANVSSARLPLDAADLGLFDITPDGKLVLVLKAGEDPRLLDLSTGKSGRVFGGHKRLVTAAALSADGKRVVTASGRRVDGHTATWLKGGWPPDAGPTELRIHDAASGEVIAGFASESLFDFHHVGFSPDGKFVWAQTAEYELLLWGKFSGPPPEVTVQWPVDPKPGPNPYELLLRPGVLDRKTPDALDKLIASLPKSGKTIEQQVDAMFLAFLGRLPTEDEAKKVVTLLKKGTHLEWLALAESLARMPEFREHAEALGKRAGLDLNPRRLENHFGLGPYLPDEDVAPPPRPKKP